jgi:hypothetical protein
MRYSENTRSIDARQAAAGVRALPADVYVLTVGSEVNTAEMIAYAGGAPAHIMFTDFNGLPNVATLVFNVIQPAHGHIV